MEKITVTKTDLLAILNENRAKHRTVFEAALAAYAVEARRILQAEVDRLSQGKLAEVYVSVPRPKDHTADYDRVIRMINLHTGDTIQLGESDAAMYVMDDWRWKRDFVRMSNSYAPGSTQAVYAVDED
jgi:hypothetical protein